MLNYREKVPMMQSHLLRAISLPVSCSLLFFSLLINKHACNCLDFFPLFALKPYLTVIFFFFHSLKEAFKLLTSLRKPKLCLTQLEYQIKKEGRGAVSTHTHRGCTFSISWILPLGYIFAMPAFHLCHCSPSVTCGGLIHRGRGHPELSGWMASLGPFDWKQVCVI